MPLRSSSAVSSKHCTIIQAAGSGISCDKASSGTGDIIAYIKDSSSNGTFVASSSGEEADKLDKGKFYGVRAPCERIIELKSFSFGSMRARRLSCSPSVTFESASSREDALSRPIPAQVHDGDVISFASKDQGLAITVVSPLSESLCLHLFGARTSTPAFHALISHSHAVDWF